MGDLLKGRLGLETARIPQSDRHGLIWLGNGRLFVEDGTLRFTTAGTDALPAGNYAIPFQLVSCIMLEPGTTVTHDALRLCARHGTGIVAVGYDGTRLYASMPFGPDDAVVARRQVELWSDPESRRFVARKMYAIRFGDVLPSENLNILRGIEGARAKAMYKAIAKKFGIDWDGRRYDRSEPESADIPNQAINHAATAVEACAMVACAVVGAIPQLGFIHEDSGISFCLDIADLYRDSVTLEVAFSAAKMFLSGKAGELTLERLVRQEAGKMFRRKKLIADMIDKMKSLLEVHDSNSNP